MVKCGPKPRKLTARQICNLAPPSPHKKKVWVRPSQYDVSLARKRRAKNYPRQMVPRKARSATSIALSAITEEIPLFEELKRTNCLVYVHVPQQPVPLCRWSFKCEYHRIPSDLVLDISPGSNNEQLCLLSTPIALSTPLGTRSCAVKVQVLSPVYVEGKLQNMPAPAEDVFHDKATIVTLSPKPALSIIRTGTDDRDAGSNRVWQEEDHVHGIESCL